MPVVEDDAGHGCRFRWFPLHGHRRLNHVTPGRPCAARRRQNLLGSHRTCSWVGRSRIPRRRPSPITDCDFAFQRSRPGSTRLSSVIVSRVARAPWSSTRASRGICCECTPSKTRSLPKGLAPTPPGSSQLQLGWRLSQEARSICEDARRKAESAASRLDENRRSAWRAAVPARYCVGDVGGERRDRASGVGAMAAQRRNARRDSSRALC
jgi:hypothetical protein